jgi:hypothetical protein
MELIRKISVGADYKNGAMHYIVGQEVLNGTHKISCIRQNNDTEEFEIWVERDDEVKKWKKFNRNMPVSTENNIDF